MTKTETWLAGYITAWQSKDPADVRAIFTDDAEYWSQPDDPAPRRGIEAIVEAWLEPEPADPDYEFGVLIENDGLGIITGRVDYPGHASYTNMWEVHFAPDGRARKFVEWYMTPRPGADAGDSA